MRRKGLGLGLIALVFLLLVLPTPVSAHQTIQVGNYDLEYGWLNEPPIAGQPNAVVINISPKGSATQAAEPTPQAAEIDISGLKIQAVVGDQSKFLTLQPLGEDTPGQFIAPMTPTRPGTYTIHLGGTLGGTTLNQDVQPEEVQTADVVQFPRLENAQGAASASTAGAPVWLVIVSLVLGAAGTLLRLAALLRKHT